MILDDKLKRIVKLVSIESKIPEATVEVAYRLYWQFIKDSLEAIPIRDIQSQEEFDKYRTSINLPSLGKMFITFDKVQKQRRRYEYLVKLFNNKEGEENV